MDIVLQVRVALTYSALYYYYLGIWVFGYLGINPGIGSGFGYLVPNPFLNYRWSTAIRQRSNY